MQLRPGNRDSIIEIPTPDDLLKECTRYAQKIGSTDTAFARIANGYWVSATTAYCSLTLPNIMRARPPLIEQNGNFLITNGATNVTGATVALESGGTSAMRANLTGTVASGGTNQNPASIAANNDTTAYILFSAEY